MAKWQAAKLGEVSTISYGYTESASAEPVGPRFLRITDIQTDGVDWGSVPFCPIEFDRIDKFRLAHDDIVFARTGATTGKSYLVENPPEAVFASYLIRLRLRVDNLLPKFLNLFFQTADYWRSIEAGSTGSAQGGFNASKLGDLTIRFPPCDEQQRIVAILDEAFKGIAIAKANAEKNLQDAKNLFESYLKFAFAKSGNGRAAKKQLDALCTFTSGGTPTKSNSSYWNGEIPWISGRDMKSTRLSDSMLHISRVAVDESSTRVAPAGSLLILVRGMGLAHGAQIGELMVQCAFNQDIRAIHPSSDLLPRYLLFALRDRINSSDSVISSAAHGTLKIDSNELQKILIPVPSLDKQQTIVAVVDDLSVETQRLAHIYERKLDALEELKKSLLHQAFTGQL